MNKKGGNVIRIVLGVYLIYLGVNIFIEVVQKNPANSGFMGKKSVRRDAKREECRRRAFSFRSGWK